MRIRQVRPEFFTDPTTSRLSLDVRLTYIGLWCVADDAGYMAWDAAHIAAMLYPYDSAKVRERRLAKAQVELMTAGRMTIFECGCAVIPTLVNHQRIGGTKSFIARDKHRVHTSMDSSIRNGSNGSDVKTRASANEDEERAEMLDSFRRLGLPVDVQA